MASEVRWIGVVTPGGTAMHWKRIIPPFQEGLMGTTMCGRTRELSLDRIGLPTCAECERKRKRLESRG